jgi:hypothetical protein
VADPPALGVRHAKPLLRVEDTAVEGDRRFGIAHDEIGKDLADGGHRGGLLSEDDR